jgi:hypothetical protein
MTLEGGGGGGGVLSPITNAVSGIAKGVTDVVKGVVQPVYNATIKNIPVVGPAIDKALVSVDKSVGKAIPGGWGTVASVAASFIPGAQPFAVGIGALNGSGVMRGNHQFNLQGAIMGGAMAYGASQFAQGLENAADPATNATTKAIEETAKAETGNIASNLGVQGASTAPGSQAAMLAQQNAGMGAAGLESIKSGANQAIQSNLANAGANAIANAGSNAAGADVFSGLAGTQGAIPPVAVPQPTSLESLGTNLTNAGKGTLSNISDAGKGIANLTGFGDKGFSGVSDAFTAFKEPITNTGIAAGLIGYSGMAALEQQQKELDAQKAAGTISSAQYDTAKARIDQEVAAARANISENPLQTSADISSVSQAPTLYAGRSRTDTLYDKEPKGGSALLYAAGGNVLMNPPDDQTGMPNQSPMQNLDQGGLMSMVNRTIPQQTFAAGGITNPRFLSGGGDGMSDSIPATINGKQEARLADGEFVIPADVVSHLGNGSSKAGAKQLYSMMDKVRQARTGNKNQGKQINPRKYLAA